MLIKWIIFLVALTAHFWLWGQWSFQESIRTTLLLSSASVLLLLLIGLPVREIIKKRNPKALFSRYWVQGVFYLYLLLIIVLGVFSFSGLIQLLLPIKVLLLVIYAGLKFYLKKRTSNS